MSILIQLRTGYNYLYRHLNRIGKVQSPDCLGCARAPETAFHYLLQCPAHRGARARLRSEVGREKMTLTGLLDEEKSLTPLFDFINSTGRFKHIFGTLPPIGRDEEEEGDR
ncbi:hypothetical protein BT96DRAFT_821048 [Gymnopus androsaceus JB14]|uniref:Reverse transcriptase zinc-binding domain-containing protein n=1 Tax=Gymnopus androsaceus JB14 TaxID=1447944 RepID=A0A6A4HM31_9AGAR|nr:hypothetical protein BT96DRAFT_821048 [Gymnopus androsaceus JB14]